MKKTFIFSTLFILVLLITSCSGKSFDMEKSIEALKEKGLTEGMCYITEEECKHATSITNSEIKFIGGNFTVEITEQYDLIENKDYSRGCTFITFATEEQAKNFASLKIDDFALNGNPNNWRIARSGSVVIMTNLDIAIETIDLEFK